MLINAACGLYVNVCIRDNIIIDVHARETGSNCFECGYCMAICKENAITLISFKGEGGRI